MLPFDPSFAAASASTADVHYGFGGVSIRDDMAKLRRARPKAACSPPVGEITDCRAPDQSLGGAYFARDLTYRFVGGRLKQIRFRSSIDGFAFVVARLRRDFGAPSEVRRDDVRLRGRDLPHVAFAWRNGRSTIQLSDPDPDPMRLTVLITADDGAIREARGSHSTKAAQ